MYNPGQQALIDAPITEKAIGVAGAGTGKTTTILARTERILKECQTGNVLLITFTRAAANDLRTRLTQKLTEALPVAAIGDNPQATAADLRRVNVGTFHSVIANFIRRHATEIGLDSNFSIIDENSTGIMFRNLVESNETYKEELLRWAADESDTKLAKKHYNLLADTVSVLINISRPGELMTGDFSKETLYELEKSAKQITSQNSQTVANYCYKLFKESMIDGKRTNTVTYDQILFIGYLMMQNDILKDERSNYIHTIVDEYQDTNRLQDDFIRYFAGDNLTIVGDIDQSIYGFRGGRPTLITEHAKEGTVYNLNENYRSYQSILDSANQIIKGNETGQEIRADLQATRGDTDGQTMTLTVSDRDILESRQVVDFIKEYHDNRGVPYNEMAILIRSRMVLPMIAKELASQSIPVNNTTKYADFMKSDEMVDTLNYLKVFVNPKDIYAFLGILDRPKKGIGPAAITKLQDYAQKHNMGLIEYILSEETKELTPSLRNKISHFANVYNAVGKYSRHTNISLLNLVKELHDKFGYREWLDTLKDADRHRANLVTLDNMIEQFDKEYRKENPNGTLFDLASAFVFDMTSVAVQNETKDGVCITTIHNAKGLEWQHIFLLGLEEEMFPGTKMLDKEDMESERRLLYVALTRAKDSVHLYAARHRVTYQDCELHPSRFIGELGITAPTYYIKE